MSYLSLGLTSLLLPAMIWVILARLRSPVVALWCLGSVLGAGGLILVGFRGSIPDWASYPVANLLAFTSGLCDIQALRLDQGAPWRLRWLVTATLGYLLVYEILRRGLGIVPLRIGFVSLVYLSLLLQLMGWAWRIARSQQSAGAWAIVGSNLVLAVGTALVLVELLQAWVGWPVPSRSRGQDELLSLLGVLAALAGDVGFLGLALERSVRRWKEAAAGEARLAERLQLGNQLAHLDRQRSLGLMAATLAHELNQPLTAILASAQAARRGSAAERLEPAQSLELLDQVIANTRRATGITERIRGFIRPSGPDQAPVDLEKVTREMLDFMAPELRRHRIQLAFSTGAEPVLVQGDAIQLSQVVLNVLRNAIEAVEPMSKRSIRIQLSRTAGGVLLQVRDSGPGLAPELAERVGTPYFTTKEQGLGMGLAISAAILQQHQGSLAFHNNEEGGARVAIQLPLLAGCGP